MVGKRGTYSTKRAGNGASGIQQTYPFVELITSIINNQHIHSTWKKTCFKSSKENPTDDEAIIALGDPLSNGDDSWFQISGEQKSLNTVAKEETEGIANIPQETIKLPM